MVAPPSSRPRRALLTAVVALAALLLLPALAGASVQYVSVEARDQSPQPDGVLGPGDRVGVTVTVANDDPDHAITSLTGTVTTTTPGVVVQDSSAVFPVVPAGGTASNANDTFSFDLPAGWQCGQVVHLGLTLVAGGVPTTVDVPVDTGVSGPRVPLAATDVPLVVQDGGFGESAVTVPAGFGVVRDVRVRVGDLTARSIGDARLELVAPHAAPVQLLRESQIGGGALSGTVSAARGTGIQSGTSPYTGTFAAPGLADLIGRDGAGAWKLRVTDTTSDGSTMVLGGWSLELAPASCEAQVVARVTASAATVDRGVPVTFDASESTTPDPDASLQYHWQIDDVAQPDTGAQLVRSWPGTGRHRVSVTVSDGTDDATDEVEVAVTVPPTAAFAPLPSGLRTADPLTLDAGASTDADGRIVSYAWDLDGDGSYEHVQDSPTWAATAPRAGLHTVRLKVTDDLGATATATRTLLVLNRPPTAALAGPAPAIRGEATTLDASGSADLDGSIATYDWTFGDGTTARTTTPTTTHVYAANGAPTAKVVVTDDTGAASAAATLALKVTDRPVAKLVADPLSGRPGDAISLSAAGSSDPDGPVSSLKYSWSFTGADTCDGAPDPSDHTKV